MADSLPPQEALEHIQTLLDAVSETDDEALIKKHLQMIRVIINRVIPANDD